MPKKPLSFTSRMRSFKHAYAGISTLLKSQQNAWIHAAATVLVITAGLCFKITPAEWCWLVLAITAVWSAEAFNTALEFLADVASPEFHPLVKQAKDVAAGAVLISAIGAAIIGSIVIGPYAMRMTKCE
ncbi:MAG: diacylglycerol kinase family protein [Opitutaceae bacterium]|jgi:diacylglycerol kinase (ATP)|nr:diacylglycerol kinase family protein [Opitutaceae bacterium]